MSSSATSTTSTPWRIPFHRNYPQDLRDKVGPRNLVAHVATDTDDPTVDPRWGKVGKQKITDEGPLPPHPIDGIKYNMETFDEVIRDKTIDFIDKAKDAEQAVLHLDEPDAHARRDASSRRSTRACATRENGWSIEEAGMAQMDDVIGAVLQHLKDAGLDDNTIVVFTTDNGTEIFTWPDGGQTPFAGGKGTALEGGFRVPAIMRWPGKVAPGIDRERHHLRARLVPDLRRCRRQSQHRGGAAGRASTSATQTYKVHLDGYNQLDFLTGKGPSTRKEILYFTETNARRRSVSTTTSTASPTSQAAGSATPSISIGRS